MDVQKVIGWNVRRIRMDAGMTQEGLAERLGIANQGYVSELEAGKRNPTAVLLAIIARALSCDVGELFRTNGIAHEWAAGPIQIRSTRTGKKEV